MVPPPSNLEDKQSADKGGKHKESIPSKSELICTQKSLQELDLYLVSEHVVWECKHQKKTHG